MGENHVNTLYPCPFSKGYGIPVEQAWSSFKVFFIYRFIVSSFFVILLYSHYSQSMVVVHNYPLYFYSSQIYWSFTLLSGFFIFSRQFNYAALAQLTLFSDIIFITLLMHACGGINSGIGILLAVSIAAGGLLIGGRCALLFAAIATLAILSEQFYSFRMNGRETTSLTYSGMLGASFFTIAYLSFILAKRTEQSEMLASRHQQTIENLEELNRYIIQHLQSGIIISNSLEQIKMCNETALNIIHDPRQKAQPALLQDISKKISESFRLWLKDSSQDFALIQLPNKNEIHLRFSLLNTRQETFHMLILDDISLYNQRLQLSKLASLGRLTASIAHEIRNPLGAISHAGQLLSEASGLSAQDQRLTEIIQSHCQRVNTIIEDVLQLSRRQLSKKEKINLNQWVQLTLQSFIRDSCCGLRCFEIIYQNSDVWTFVDSGHLKQIFYNVCSNALKYGNRKNGKILIEISQTSQSSCISIFDNGAVIDSETTKHLFEPFFTTSATGTGLGLYICKELAELNQAKLTYVVRENKNCFKLTLPKLESSKIVI